VEAGDADSEAITGITGKRNTKKLKIAPDANAPGDFFVLIFAEKVVFYSDK